MKFIKSYRHYHPKLSKKPLALLVGLVMISAVNINAKPTVKPAPVTPHIVSNISIPAPVLEAPKQSKEIRGYASWYDYTLKNGWSSQGHYVCASKDFPRGSTLRVTSITNSRYVECLVTDYGPDVKGRVIDLSSSAFSQLTSIKVGITPVKVELVSISK